MTDHEKAPALREEAERLAGMHSFNCAENPKRAKGGGGGHDCTCADPLGYRTERIQASLARAHAQGKAEGRREGQHDILTIFEALGRANRDERAEILRALKARALAAEPGGGK